MYQLTDLPDTLFLEVLYHLTPREIVLCRLVSRASHAALTRPDLSQALLHVFFPRSLECRLLRARVSSQAQERLAPPREHKQPRREGPPTGAAGAEPDWPALFARVARRYHNLSRAAFHSLTTIPILKPSAPLRRFAPWARQLAVDVHLAHLALADPNWTYADGVLVYPSPSPARPAASSWPCSGATSPESSSASSTSSTSSEPPVLKVLDLNSGDESTVPFDWAEKVVRRVRLAEGLLVVEWAEAQGSHPLNEGEVAHRHFATAFDVRAVSSPLCPSGNRPPVKRDGSGNPAATGEGGDDAARDQAPMVAFRSEWKIHYLGLPIHISDRIFSTHNATHYALFAHQPNRSPWGEDTPLERLVVWSLNGPSPYRPSLDLSCSDKPPSDPGPEIVLRLTNGELDHWGVRQLHTPRLMRLALDAVPHDGDETDAVRGHVFVQEEDHIWSSGPHASENPPARHTVRSVGIPLSGAGPRWVHECGADGDAERSFCPVARSRPGAAAETAWPGRAPCWRHEEFPYLTVAEAVDAAAGVRVCGRRCFAMTTVSASVDDGGRRRDDAPGEGEASAGAETAVRGEAQFDDDMWKTLMKGAALAGDERWVIGEDTAGDVSVVRF
ncbi:F-box domain-containing protein [Colletotrichum navitas]|uniref:F-box domain-containing protein n=1 Tax=Colletotrichum navitas TaxID=681940 RepID=A0AAD8QFC0_9PEZI|nr:F-box domain-containing protein [Colletotrichum navitas]KAK1600372.1 F-box domain-containing protein [Colletotrichum navitas]